MNMKQFLIIEEIVKSIRNLDSQLKRIKINGLEIEADISVPTYAEIQRLIIEDLETQLKVAKDQFKQF